MSQNENAAIASLNKMNLNTSEKTWIIKLHEHATNTKCIAENRPFVTGVGNAEKIAMLLRPDCKRWNCPHCAAKNARRWIARIINHINRKKRGTWQMFTLTAHENWRGVDSSLKNLRAGWKKLYNRINYKFGVEDYVKVWEAHVDGSLHLHGLICDEIGDNVRWLEDNPAHMIMSERWLKNNARQCGMGYQVKLREVENAGQVAGYISKYFMKSEEIGALPKGLRRIEVSRNWDKLPDLQAENTFSWLLNETREGQLRTAQQYFNMGYDVIDTLSSEYAVIDSNE